MDPPAVAAAKIHQGGREQIGGRGQRNQLGDPQPAPAWKTTVDQQPSVGCSQQSARHSTSQKQCQCSKNLATAIGTKCDQTLLKPLDAFPEELNQGPDGQECQQRCQQPQQASAHDGFFSRWRDPATLQAVDTCSQQPSDLQGVEHGW